MAVWTLPRSVEICGVRYAINADFRDILDIISRLSDLNTPEQERTYVALALFYVEFPTMPPEHYEEAVSQLQIFLNCGSEDFGPPSPKVIDWEQDHAMIVADINKAAGREIREMAFCHWWTFIAWFNGIGEGQLSTVVSIREKKRKGKKLSDWEREFYNSNREKIDFKTNYTDAEDQLLDLWLGK
jgi:hypothetical protein